MKRHLWKRSFSMEAAIVWPCPACSEGRLQIEKGTVSKGHTAQSAKDKKERGWEPEWTEERFSCLLRCRDCLETVAVVGRCSLSEVWEPDEEGCQGIGYDTEYEPRFFLDAPPIIGLPKSLPKGIEKEMCQSFQLFWSDTSACSNRIRCAVELLLDDLKVKRTTVSRGKRSALTLHSRIEAFKLRNQKVGDALLAIKWIGNAGSHSSSLTDDDILDGYEIIEHVFEQIYEKKAERIQRMTKRINKTKKPLSSQGRRALMRH